VRRLTLLAFAAVIVPLVGTTAFAHEGHKKEHNHPYPKQNFSLKRGAELYRQYCAECHGKTGYNPGPFPPYMDPVPTNFLDREYMVMKSRIDLFEATRDGRPGTRMRAWKDRLSEEEI
jgi:mono/diheme cytochrome c family protein